MSGTVSAKQSHDSLLCYRRVKNPKQRAGPQHAPRWEGTHKKIRAAFRSLHETQSSWMLISLSRRIFLLLVADLVFPLVCKSLSSAKISSKPLLRYFLVSAAQKTQHWQPPGSQGWIHTRGSAGQDACSMQRLLHGAAGLPVSLAHPCTPLHTRAHSCTTVHTRHQFRPSCGGQVAAVGPFQRAARSSLLSFSVACRLDLFAYK